MAGCTFPSQEVPLAAFHLVLFFWHVQLWWPTRSQASSWKSYWAHSRHSRNHAVSKYNEKQRNAGKRKLGINCDWDINRTIVYYSTFYHSNQDQRFCLLSSYENLIWIKLRHSQFTDFLQESLLCGFFKNLQMYFIPLSLLFPIHHLNHFYTSKSGFCCLLFVLEPQEIHLSLKSLF